MQDVSTFMSTVTYWTLIMATSVVMTWTLKLNILQAQLITQICVEVKYIDRSGLVQYNLYSLG